MSFESIDLSVAAKHLAEGGLLTFPTETVYGVGCVFDDEGAYERLVALKKRPPNKPFSLMTSSLSMALPYLDPSDKRLSFMRRVFPGELTVLLKAAEGLPEHVTLGTGIIGLRVPDSRDVKALISKVGKPCLVTSANISGMPAARRYEDLDPAFLEKTMMIKGTCDSLIPSTIVDISGPDISLVRPGPVPFDLLQKAWLES